MYKPMRDTMRIIYVFVENFRCLKRKGFNISSKYNISCDVIRDDLRCPQYSLSITENPHYIAGFWGDSIIDASVIIGANASGKSTFLTFLSEVLPKGLGIVTRNNERTGRFVFLLEDNNKLILHDPEHLIWKFSSKKPSRQNDNQWFKDQREHLDFILYSGHFDNLKSRVNWVGLQDLRTENLLRRSIDNTVSQKMRDKKVNVGALLVSAFRTFENEELTRQVKLSKSILAHKVFLKPPKYFRINMALQDIEANIAKQYPNIEKIYAKRLTQRSKFLVAIFSQGFLSFIQMNERFLNNEDEGFKKKWTIFKKAIKDFDNKIAQISEDKLLIDSLAENFRFICDKSPILGLDEQFKVWNILRKNTFDSDWLPEESWTSVGILFSQVTSDIIEEYYKTNQICDYLHLSISQDKHESSSFSSGELSALNLYSRLHNLKGYGELGKNLIIAIDEAEVALHPEWQRQYLKNLLRFLKIEFPEESGYQIQLIICSHSPLILSDIPKECINYIGDSAPGEETFASNIYSLYQHSFFLNGGLVGAFAQQKIKALIKQIEELTDNNLSDEVCERIEQQIKIIGEPFMQKKLWDLYYTKIPQKYKKRIKKHRIELLQKELNLLKEEDNND